MFKRSSTNTTEELWGLYRQGHDPATRERLVMTYLPLVRSVVSRLGVPTNNGILESDDLVSFGVVGLLEAIDRYDEERGFAFETFAQNRIKGAIIDQLRSLNWMPRDAVARYKQIETALQAVEQRLQRSATEEEVAAELKISVEEYRNYLMHARGALISLDQPMRQAPWEDENQTLADSIEDTDAQLPEDHIEKLEASEKLSQALLKIPERERILLSLYYQEELTLDEISKVFEISEARVCQLHLQALLRLRSYMKGTARVQPIKVPAQTDKQPASQVFTPPATRVLAAYAAGGASHGAA